MRICFAYEEKRLDYIIWYSFARIIHPKLVRGRVLDKDEVVYHFFKRCQMKKVTTEYTTIEKAQIKHESRRLFNGFDVQCSVALSSFASFEQDKLSVSIDYFFVSWSSHGL